MFRIKFFKPVVFHLKCTINMCSKPELKKLDLITLEIRARQVKEEIVLS